MITIRSANVADAAELSRLCVEHAAYEQTQLESAGYAEQLQGLLSDERAGWWSWVVETGGELCGYAAMTLDVSTWRAERYAHLDCLFLQPAIRGNGVGQQLLAEVIRHAKALGCTQMQWQTPVWNQDAIRFYRRQGATMVDKARFSLSLPAAMP